MFLSNTVTNFLDYLTNLVNFLIILSELRVGLGKMIMKKGENVNGYREMASLH
jgi:hypothetical protein